ncbi:hypothetical protein F5Y10DRAFT_53109 [Nemania abortiva]|nr:hypothetical protein F5Y10DRAFT_53109 [Nemania abortiva]
MQERLGRVRARLCSVIAIVANSVAKPVGRARTKQGTVIDKLNYSIASRAFKLPSSRSVVRRDRHGTHMQVVLKISRKGGSEKRESLERPR